MNNTLLLLAAATLPSMAIAYWIYLQDEHEKEPKKMLLWAFLCGCASTIPAIIGQTFFKNLENPDNLFQTAIFAFGVVAVSEELSKYLFLRRFIYPQKDFNEPIDGIIYGVMVGLGFATLENVLYVFNADGHGFSTALGRAFTAVPAHASFGALMGAYVGLAKFFPEKRAIYMLIGLGLAIFFHGAYDFFLMQQVYEGMVFMAIFTLVWGITMSRRLIKVGQELSPFKNKGVEQPIVKTEMIEEIEENRTQSNVGISEENTVKNVENPDFI